MEKIPAKIADPKVYQTILAHQTSDLTTWKTKLKPDTYTALELWATETNDTVTDPYHIRRGHELVLFIQYWTEDTIDMAHKEWLDLVDYAKRDPQTFWMGSIELSGTLNSFKEMVMDMGASFDTTEPPNYISGFMFAVEAYYQSYYGLDQDCFEKVHGEQDFEIYRKNLVRK